MDPAGEMDKREFDTGVWQVSAECSDFPYK